MIRSPHRRFYPKANDRVRLTKFNIKSGMIVEFPYTDKFNNKSKPLVFVMDTDEFTSPEKKNFSGINLNYLPYLQIERFFVKMLSRAGWDKDKHTKIPKVNLWEEEDSGVRPLGIYKTFLKTSLLKRFDCWRSYKYKNVRSVFQIKYHFKTKPLSEVYDIALSKAAKTKDKELLPKVSKTEMYKLLRNMKENEDKL